MGDKRRQLLVRLKALLGPEGLLCDAAARRVYSLDSSHLTLGRPWVVALPETPEKLVQVVSLCAEAGVSMVCRGSGTGLSGGAVPNDGALVLGTARLNQAEPVSSSDRTIRVQVGILNEQVSTLAAPHGLHFAPDPSSQAAATIGGNIAENAGGPHCLRYGVTLQHLRNLNWVDAGGHPWNTGRGLPAERGLDLVSLLCGSEGTLGVITEADLKLVPNPSEVITLLAFFPDLHDATSSVVSLLTAGLLPVAVEMVDQPMLIAVEEAFAFGFPTDVEAAMIAEFSGSAEEVAEDVKQGIQILSQAGAREVQQASDPAQRLELWKCRKKAFGAVGRLAPHYVTMDVVVPLGRLPELVRHIQEIKTRCGVEVATAFHAGDGNLHPGVHYDDRIAGQTEKAHQAAGEIIRTALDMDGSATGEHGVGIDKQYVLPWQWDAETARLSRGIKTIFDPRDLLNPGKLFPAADAVFAPCKTLPETLHFRWDSMSVTTPAHVTLAEIQNRALEQGLCLPVGIFRSAQEGTLGLGAATNVGDLVAQLVPGPSILAMGTARDFLLELWARTGDGKMFHTGAPVFKNVAGYGLGQSLCGSGRHFVEPLAATFQLRPVCEAVLAMAFSLDQTRVEPLLSMLPLTDVASPVVVLDPKQDRLLVLVGGRKKDWGLGRLAASVAEILQGSRLVFQEMLAPTNLADFLESDFLPDWARSSTNWTMISRPPGHSAGQVPAGPGPWIWQGIPGLWWTPDPAVGSSSHPGNWYSDQLLRNGQVIATASAASTTPIHLLEKLKNLFDPSASLDDLPKRRDGHEG